MDDVNCLIKIYTSMKQDQDLMNSFVRGSYLNKSILTSPISSYGGYLNYLKFEENNIKTIGNLYDKYNQYKNMELFEKYLKNDVGIYSPFILNKFCEQMSVLEDLLN